MRPKVGRKLLGRPGHEHHMCHPAARNDLVQLLRVDENREYRPFEPSDLDLFRQQLNRDAFEVQPVAKVQDANHVITEHTLDHTFEIVLAVHRQAHRRAPSRPQQGAAPLEGSAQAFLVRAKGCRVILVWQEHAPLHHRDVLMNPFDERVEGRLPLVVQGAGLAVLQCK